MKEIFRFETQRLAKSWLRHDCDTLLNYLVQDVEDPRINVQSMLTRQFLIRRLFGNRFDYLMDQELRFGLVVNWLLRILKSETKREQLRNILITLLTGKNEIHGLWIPTYISDTFCGLSLPNYICDLINWTASETTETLIPDFLMSTFERIWSEVLEVEQCRGFTVLEPACGSANDYRFIETFGIARMLDYTGFDLCKKNISNAMDICSSGRFEVGNVLEINADGKTFDYCFVHDLFEHLSIEAMEAAISELCRVTRREICVGFFNMHPDNEHFVRPVGDYHWNCLSLPRTKSVFERYASAIRVIHIDGFLKSNFDCCDTHNKGAYTLIVKL